MAMDEMDLMTDPKYKTYVKQVDNALKGFEYTSEWADLVNALGKLNKVTTVCRQVHDVLPLILLTCDSFPIVLWCRRCCKTIRRTLSSPAALWWGSDWHSACIRTFRPESI